ncbi:conserved hypothetical protein [Neospora caninum Liverpool]|nr:conserved hypothetical protein [Neospora caninum Liverpool]CBZ51604.1 conserved hypothetical protein [Neospora caninum Liverpool]|eukprot:XP_003881637.1 conserved hypothetical protein [Neospora caninum Liverpool]
MLGFFSSKNAISSISATPPAPTLTWPTEAPPTRRSSVQLHLPPSDRPLRAVAPEIPVVANEEPGGSISQRSSREYPLSTVPLAQAVANAWPHSTPAAPFQPQSSSGSDGVAFSEDLGTPGRANSVSRVLKRDATFPLSARQLRELPQQSDHTDKALVNRKAHHASTGAGEHGVGPGRSFTETSTGLVAPGVRQQATEVRVGGDTGLLTSKRDDPGESTHQLDAFSERETGDGGLDAETEATDESKTPPQQPASPVGEVCRDDKGGVKKQLAVTAPHPGNGAAIPSIYLAYDQQPRVCLIVSPRFEPELRVRRSSAPSVQIYTDLPMDIHHCFDKPDKVSPTPVPWTPAWLRDGSVRKSPTSESGAGKGTEQRVRAGGPAAPRTLDRGSLTHGKVDEHKRLWDTQQPTIVLHPPTAVFGGPTGQAKGSERRTQQHRMFVVVDVTSEWWPSVQLQYVHED